ncbi:hypothetical protein [Belnapia moabensis]|uniref:hypothetical protein n=1 Tax=Belnapia moabensis TaxID=365533 RepID=UPI0012ECF9A3|nr:hypothetical protein [Belnapia moabensis]
MAHLISASDHAVPDAALESGRLGGVLVAHLAVLLIRASAAAILLSPLLIAWLLW